MLLPAHGLFVRATRVCCARVYLVWAMYRESDIDVPTGFCAVFWGRPGAWTMMRPPCAGRGEDPSGNTHRVSVGMCCLLLVRAAACTGVSCRLGVCGVDHSLCGAGWRATAFWVSANVPGWRWPAAMPVTGTPLSGMLQLLLARCVCSPAHASTRVWQVCKGISLLFHGVQSIHPKVCHCDILSALFTIFRQRCTVANRARRESKTHVYRHHALLLNRRELTPRPVEACDNCETRVTSSCYGLDTASRTAAVLLIQ